MPYTPERPDMDDMQDEQDYTVSSETNLVHLARLADGQRPFPEARAPEEHEVKQAVRLLTDDRKRVFRTDGDHRNALLRIPISEQGGLGDAFAESGRIYQSTLGALDTGGAPLFPLIRGAVDEYIAFALSGIPSGSLDVETPPSLLYELMGVWKPGLKPDERVLEVMRVIMDQNRERMRAVVKADMKRNQWSDLKELVMSPAAIYGVGYIGFFKPGTLSDRSADQRRMLRNPEALLDPGLRKALERARDRGSEMRTVNPQNVYWQAGIRSAFSHERGQEMMRVSVHDRLLTAQLNRAYGRDDILPGQDTWGLYDEHYKPGTKHDDTTGVVETWEIVDLPTETTVERSEVRPDGSMYTERHTVEHMERYRVRTKLAGDVLLEVEVQGAAEGTTALPIVPFYLMEHDAHPYGYSLVMRLKRIQDLINRVLLLIYETGAKSLSNQGGFLVSNWFAKDADLDEIVKGLRSGEIVKAALNEELFVDGQAPNMNSIFISSAQATANLTPALIDLLKILMDVFKSSSEMTDLEGVRRARTSIAKQAQVAINDRPKSVIVSRQSKSIERAVEVCAEQWRGTGSNEVVECDGRYVVLNETSTATLPKFQPSGEPVVIPPAYIPLAREQYAMEGKNPALIGDDGTLYREVPVTLGDTDLDWHATADSRSWLPHDPSQRMAYMVQLREAGVITSNQTIRDEMPTEVRDRDDRNAAADQEQAMQQQLQMMQMQQAGMSLPSEAAYQEDPMAARMAAMEGGALEQAEAMFAQQAPDYASAPLEALAQNVNGLGLPAVPGSSGPGPDGIPVAY